MTQPAPETEIVQGNVSGIIQKGPDKWQVAVVPFGSQYAKNLWTKDAALVQQLSQLIGSDQAFNCNASHWNMQDGTPVRSLWINGVGPGQQAQQWGQAQQPQAPPQPAPQPSPGFQTVGQVLSGTSLPQPQTGVQGVTRFETQDEKRTSIHRQCATKVASWLFQADAQGGGTLFPPDVPRDFSTFLSLTERLFAYYERGLAAEADHVPFGSDGEQPPPHPLDDPFPPGY